MKNKNLMLTAIFCVTMLLIACGKANKKNDKTDSQNPQDTVTKTTETTDGDKEKTDPRKPIANLESIKIGTQIWTVKNLDIITFRNGDTIPEVKTKRKWDEAGDQSKPAWCYYDFDPENGKKYGKLYNLYAVTDERGFIPNGWHLPTSVEWRTLINYLGGELVAGAKLKSTAGWEDYEDTTGNGNNSSGFNGLPAGYCFSNGDCFDLEEEAYFWSNDQDYFYPNYFSLTVKPIAYPPCNNYRCTNDIFRSDGYSVRCIKN